MPSGARSAPLVRHLVALAAVMVAPLAFRVVLIRDRTGGFAAQDLRGFLSDAAISLLVLALLVVLSLGSRLAAALLAAVWVLLQHGNHETVRELGALASALDAHFLGDTTFVLGSALAISKPVLLGALLVAVPILTWKGLRGASLRSALASLLAAALLIGAYSLWPWTAELAVWRQTNFVQYNAERWILAGWRDRGPRPSFPDPAAAMLDLVPGLAADLDGEPILSTDGRATNVLLVITESVSGAHIESIAQAHGRFVAGKTMPELDAVARAHLSYATFFAQQRKTNRGLFAILCGELPNLAAGLPKMSEFSQRGWRTCLPDLLRDAGYQTVYLQAAPLAFMLKDQFMPKIGFERVYGHKWFTRHHARSKWGVDDRAFFEQSLEMIEELRKEENPWFLALLTVGSHHPFVIPHDFQSERKNEFLRALSYSDLAIGEFYRNLEDRGVLRDTLVLFTSDEARGLTSNVNAVTRTLTQNWGYLIAAAPNARPMRVREPFGQLDLALSVLDYLGLADRGTQLFGRSVFRRYERGRYLFFANTNVLSNGAIDPSGQLLLCLNDYRICNKYALPHGQVFGPGRVRVPWNPNAGGIVRELARRSLHSHADQGPRRDFELLVDPVFVTDAPIDQVVHGGQYVDLRPGEWIEVDLEVEATASAGHAELRHMLRSARGPWLYNTRVSLRDGETLRMRYTFAPQRPLDGVRCRTLAHVVDAPSAELHFKTARMSMHREGKPPGPGVEVQLHEVAVSGDVP